jgi:anti-anti-sigma factor
MAPLSVVTRASDDGSVLLLVSGEVDVSSVQRLNDALAEALDRPVRAVVVDLANVRFFSAAGVSSLMRAHSRAAAADVRLCAANCSPIVRKVLEVVDVWKLFTDEL